MTHKANTKGNNQLRVSVFFSSGETINTGSVESSVAAPPMDTIADEEIVMTKNSSDQHIKRSGREKEKEKKATQSQEERALAEEKEKGEAAKEEERQQAEVTRRFAETVGPYVESPSDKASR
jgi:hypothetical protein